MKQYILGIIFDETKENVLLIRKNKPSWQNGYLNGIGGKLEDFDKTPIDGIKRETLEETGLEIDDWYWLDTILFNDDVTLYIYFAVTDISLAQSLTDEPVEIHSLNEPIKDIIDDVNIYIDNSLKILNQLGT